MTTTIKRKKHFIPNFEASSVVLVAALALGTLAAVTASRAQTSPPAATPAPAAAGGASKTSAKDLDAAFGRADVNKDGRLDKKEAEVMPAIAERFG